MVCECALFCVGVVIQLCSFYVWQQVAVGRLISGLAVGALSAAVPMVRTCILHIFHFPHAAVIIHSSIKLRQLPLKFEERSRLHTNCLSPSEFSLLVSYPHNQITNS